MKISDRFNLPVKAIGGANHIIDNAGKVILIAGDSTIDLARIAKAINGYDELVKGSHWDG